MARPIWRGSLNFGLVTVPVQLYSATEDHTIHFRQLERGTGDRVRYRRVNERTGEEVHYDDVVKGYELDDGDYVVIEPEELEEITPGRSRTINIEAFVGMDDIDPIYFQKSYWLAPSDQDFARAYGLLIQAMRQTNRAGIARFVMRNREYVAAVRATSDNVLALDTLLFAEDVRDPQQAMGSLPDAGEPRGNEVDMAVQLIESMSEDWNPSEFHDTYNERVRQLVADKEAGREVTPEGKPSEPTKVVDLFDALSASVQGRGGGSRKSRRTRQRKRDSGPDLSQLRKTDLDEMAKEANIHGRSKMTREQLEDALRNEAAGNSSRSAS